MTRILAIGETLWDVFPDGPRFGGAPCNFACACAGLGGEAVRVAVASAVGRDDLGSAAVARLAEAGVDTSLIAAVDRPTGRVDVSFDAAGQPRYEFAADPAWDRIAWDDRLAADVDVLYFGTLAQRAPVSRATIRRLLSTPSGRSDARPLRVLDINLRPPFWTAGIIRESLPLADALKLNEDELPAVAAAVGLAGGESDVLGDLIARYGFRLVALTRGAGGSTLVTAGGVRSDRPCVPVEVVDTVGAGDSFTAALAIGLTAGLTLDRLHDWAGRVAAFTCTQAGGTPRFPPHLRLSETARNP
jgi:fructokinase